MTTGRLYAVLDEFSASAAKLADWLRSLASLSNSSKAIASDLGGIVEQAQANAAHARELLNQMFAQAMQDARVIRSRQIHAGIEELQRALKKLAADAPQFAELANQLVGLADDLADKFDDFIGHQTRPNIGALLSVVSEFYGRVNNLIASVESVRNSLQLDRPGGATFSFEVATSVQYEEFAERIVAFGRAYIAACKIKGIDPSTEPLRIVRVESGSVFLAVLGNTVALGFMISALTATAVYLYKNYTRDGRRAKVIDESRESLETFAFFREFARSQGLEEDTVVKEMQDTVDEFSRQIASFGRGDRIWINGEEVDCRAPQLPGPTTRPALPSAQSEAGHAIVPSE